MDHLAINSALTPRECEVYALMLARKKSREIAGLLGCSVHTVKRHRDHIREKLGLKAQAQIAKESANVQA